MAIKRVILHSVGSVILAASVALAGSIPAFAATATGTAATTSDSSSFTIYAFGTVQSGVEGGCLLLATSYGVQYNLLGGDPAVLRPGATVLVSGRLSGAVATTCMQGYPLQVTSATPL